MFDILQNKIQGTEHLFDFVIFSQYKCFYVFKFGFHFKITAYSYQQLHKKLHFDPEPDLVL